MNDGNKEKGFDAGIPDFEQLDDDMPEDMYMDEDLPFRNVIARLTLFILVHIFTLTCKQVQIFIRLLIHFSPPSMMKGVLTLVLMKLLHMNIQILMQA